MTGAPNREVFMCKGEGYGVVGESAFDPYTVTRHQSATEPCMSIFAAAMEPYKGETFVTNIRPLDMQPYTASEPGLEPVAIVVETRGEKTFYILHNPDRDTLRTLQFPDRIHELIQSLGVFVEMRLDFGVCDNCLCPSMSGKSSEKAGSTPGLRHC